MPRQGLQQAARIGLENADVRIVAARDDPRAIESVQKLEGFLRMRGNLQSLGARGQSPDANRPVVTRRRQLIPVWRKRDAIHLDLTCCNLSLDDPRLRVEQAHDR